MSSHSVKVAPVHRIENTSGPSEEVFIFALQSPDDRWKDTRCVTRGPQLSQVKASMMQKLEARGAKRSGKKVH